MCLLQRFYIIYFTFFVSLLTVERFILEVSFEYHSLCTLLITALVDDQCVKDIIYLSYKLVATN